MKSFSIINLGCPKNLVDSERISDIFVKNGYFFKLDGENCHSIVINTCAFIKDAVKESDRVIKRFVRLKKNGKIKKLYVAGCLVSRFKEKIFNLYPSVDAFFDINSYNKIDSFLKNDLFEKMLVNGDEEYYSRFLLTSSHVAYLKISDGCDNNCSYCLIPKIRGRYRSTDLNLIINEAKAISGAGVKELVVISQDTLRYGFDLYRKKMITKLVKELEKIDGIEWIRLMYLYPSEIDYELIKLIKNSSKILHYFDIPLQHVSDRILKMMNRRYDSKKLKETFDLIYKNIPDAWIRVNFIVGFPTETDSDFRKILDFLNSYPVYYVNVFKYSNEEGTAAYNYRQISPDIKQKRYKVVVDVASRRIDDMNKKISGKTFRIIADSSEYGRSYMDAPEIDGRFKVKGFMKKGSFYDVKVIKAKDLTRYCSIVSEV